MAPVEWLIGRVLERASARAGAESTRASVLIAALAGKRLAIQILGTPWADRPMCVESDGKVLRLARSEGSGSAATSAADSVAAAPRDTAGAAHALLIGPPLSLLALSGADPEAPVRRGDVRIEGDAQVAQQYRELSGLLLPDLEDSLAQLMGRGAAHFAARGVRGAADLVRTAAWNSVQNLAEFLAHESGDLVSRHEAEHFLRGVDELREQLDRLDARLSDLERRAVVLAGTAGST
jgi:ubiquinone biosynthesis accessory factor UbiJ